MIGRPDRSWCRPAECNCMNSAVEPSSAKQFGQSCLRAILILNDLTTYLFLRVKARMSAWIWADCTCLARSVRELAVIKGNWFSAMSLTHLESSPKLAFTCIALLGLCSWG